MLEGEFNFKPDCGFPTRRIVVGNRDQFEEMLKAMVANKVRPVVDRVFSFDRLKDALRLMESGKFFGKIAVAID
jgi:NADPH:quinone reductase-like Zn-dependent oxidoreductase